MALSFASNVFSSNRFLGQLHQADRSVGARLCGPERWGQVRRQDVAQELGASSNSPLGSCSAACGNSGNNELPFTQFGIVCSGVFVEVCKGLGRGDLTSLWRNGDCSITCLSTTLFLFAFVLLPLLGVAAPPGASVESLLKDMRAGGYVVFVRHPEASVGNDSEGLPEWWKDCAKQRLLSESGKVQARKIGAGLRSVGAPLVVKASEYCRAVESVLFMGFREFTVTPALNHLSAWPREAQMNDGIREAMRGMLAAVPAPGTNTLLVGHVQNYAQPPDAVLTTMNMGDTAIFKPDGKGGFLYMALLHPEDWGP